MLNRFLAFISEKQLVRSVQPWLVAVSGGLDSVCLAHLCKQAGISFAIAHCNFGLRAAESDGDETFVKLLAEQYGVPFFSTRFDTETYAITHKLSIQQAARELRYSWFEQLRLQNSFSCIATAHHRSDVAETMLINQLRGTGIEGLHGIKPRNGYVIRPLLFADRQELQDYASEVSLSHREDSSNQSDKYLRNAIRHQVIPALKQLEPQAEQVFSENAARFYSFEQLALNLIKQQWEKVTEQRGETLFISLALLKEQFPVAEHCEEFLYQNLKHYGFNADTAALVPALLDAQSGKQLLSETHTLLKDRDSLILTPRHARAETVIEIHAMPPENFRTGAFSFELLPIADVDLKQASPDVAYLDADALVFPLEIRTWQHGDTMKPLGLKGNKKISDILVDAKIPLAVKTDVQVLVSANDIAWLVGMRISEHFKIGENTLKVLKITCYSVFSPESQTHK